MDFDEAKFFEKHQNYQFANCSTGILEAFEGSCNLV